MRNPLEPIWAAYKTSKDALKVVRRSVMLGAAYQDRPFRNTSFHKQDVLRLTSRLDEADSQMDDLALLSLYAAFEARLRDHVSGCAGLLRRAGAPDRQFGQALAEEFSKYVGGPRFGKLIEPFAHAVGEKLVAQTGNIREFRHWVAHGRRGPTPPSVPPLSAYKTLTKFLQLARLL